jgi:hypothetical protein
MSNEEDEEGSRGRVGTELMISLASGRSSSLSNGEALGTGADGPEYRSEKDMSKFGTGRGGRAFSDVEALRSSRPTSFSRWP